MNTAYKLTVFLASVAMSTNLIAEVRQFESTTSLLSTTHTQSSTFQPIETNLTLVDSVKNEELDTIIKPAEINEMKEAILSDSIEKLLKSSFINGFTEGSICTTPFPISDSMIDPHRSLLVHDAATLSSPGVDFSLEKTLNLMATQASVASPGTSAGDIFQKLWDTQNTSGTAALTANAHCDDNGTTLNGFPLTKCPRQEGIEAHSADLSATMADYQPTALVNRLDLAHKGWKNCGEHRMIYGKSLPSKNLIIFESVLPNPTPGCRSGCRDVIDFWANLSNDSNPDSRASKLENFFYNGLPGFSPVVHVNHYNSSTTSSVYGGSGSGQIRTNQFLEFPWMLKEFKTQTTCTGPSCDFDIIPISVKGNPYGELWSKDVANDPTPTIPDLNVLATDFQAQTLSQVTGTKLGHTDINRFSYAVQPRMNAGESNSQDFGTIDHYKTQLLGSTDNSFESALNTAGDTLSPSLSATQLVNRATALSCAGCHMPNTFGLLTPGSIGPGQSWPNALSFVHVDTNPSAILTGIPEFNVAHFAGNPNGFDISPALQDVFLPDRKSNLVSEFNKDICNCEPNIISIGPIFFDRKSLVISKAVQELVNPKLIDQANEQLALETKRFENIKRPTQDEIEKSLTIRKKILKAVTDKFQETPELKSLRFTDISSEQLIESITLSERETENLSKNELSQLKVKIATELNNKRPQRETVTNSFRVH